jgi:hypothetical protein
MRNAALIHPIVTLYDAASTQLRQTTVYSPAIADKQMYAGWEPIDLSALTNYFIGVTNPSAVTPFKDPYYFIFQEAAARSAYPLGDGLRWARAHRTGAGAWTVIEEEVPMMALLIDGVG